MALATSREADETNGNILFLFLLYHAILFCQIKFVKIKAKVYFCKVGTEKYDRNEGKPVNEGDAPPPSNQ